MSSTVAPTRAASMPASSAAWQTSSRRCASVEISPTGNVAAESAIRPSFVTPTSNEMMSPSLRAVVARDAVDDHLVRRDADRGRDSPCSPSRSGRRRASGCTPRRSGRARPSRCPARAAPPSARACRRRLAGARHQLDLVRALADDHARVLRPARARSWISAQTSSIVRSACSGTSLPVDAVVLDDRLGLRVVDLEPARDHLGRVVGAALLVGARRASARWRRRPGGRRRGSRRASRPISSSSSSSASAWARLRGKPSSTKPSRGVVAARAARGSARS